MNETQVLEDPETGWKRKEEDPSYNLKQKKLEHKLRQNQVDVKLNATLQDRLRIASS